MLFKRAVKKDFRGIAIQFHVNDAILISQKKRLGKEEKLFGKVFFLNKVTKAKLEYITNSHDW